MADRAPVPPSTDPLELVKEEALTSPLNNSVPALAKRRLSNTEKAAARAVAEAVAAELGETDATVLRSLYVLTKRYGEPFVRERVAKVREVEAAGGMLVKSGLRRRTPGGVFFLLAKQSIGTKAWFRLFPVAPRPDSSGSPVDGATGPVP